MLELPFPVAHLLRRAGNAKSPKERHDAAYFAWEVSIRLCLADRPPDDPAVMVRATVGKWVRAARLPDGSFERLVLNAKKIQSGKAEDLVLKRNDTVVVGEWFL